MLARVAHCPNRPPPDRPGQQRQALPGQQARLVVIAELPRSLRAAQCRAYRVELPGVSQALRSADEDDDQVPTAHAEDYWLPPGELSQIDRTGGKGDHDVFRCLGCTRAECKAWPLLMQPGGGSCMLSSRLAGVVHTHLSGECRARPSRIILKASRRKCLLLSACDNS